MELVPIDKKENINKILDSALSKDFSIEDIDLKFNILKTIILPTYYKYFSGIYFIFCKSNNKIYVGSSLSLAKRYSEHRNMMLNLKHNSKINNSIKKHGLENFIFGILKICQTNELIECEQFFIDKLKAHLQFNINPKAESSLGVIRRPESIKKNSLSNLGRKQSKETIEKKRLVFSGNGNPMYNKKHSDATKELMRKKANERCAEDPSCMLRNIEKLHICAINQVHSLGRRRKMSEKFSGENNPTAKLNEQDVLEIINYINAGYSLTKISKMFGVCFQNISTIKNGKSWKYLNHLIEDKFKNLKSKPKMVYQYDKAGLLINVFPSITQAAIRHGIKREYIYRCCNGVDGIKQSHGYIWSFDELFKNNINNYGH